MTAIGGGGGGGGSGNTGGNGGNGGSGVVILRYITGTLTASGGTVTASGSYTIHTFNLSGTFTVSNIAVTSGSYRSILTSLQQPKKSVNLWVKRNWTARFNPASSVSQGATSLTVSGDQRGKFANGDTIDIFTLDNLVRERKTLSLVPTYASASNQTTLTFTPGTSNNTGFDTTAFVERVDVIPQVSLVNKGSADNFVGMTYKNSIIDFANNEVEDEYEYVASQAEEDFRVKLNLSRNDTSLIPYAKKVMVQLGN